MKLPRGYEHVVNNSTLFAGSAAEKAHAARGNPYQRVKSSGARMSRYFWRSRKEVAQRNEVLAMALSLMSLLLAGSSALASGGFIFNFMYGEKYNGIVKLARQYMALHHHLFVKARA